MGFMGFQGVRALLPTLSKVAAVTMATFICGEVAGVINIGVGIVSLKEAIQALHNGDKLLGVRLLLDGIFLMLIGIGMILISTGLKAVALGAVTAFFVANPWVLPLLFFIITIPLMIEISKRVIDIWSGNDLASKLPLEEIKVELLSDELVWDNITNLLKDTPFDLQELSPAGLSDKMETFQADMGVSAAIEAFKFLEALFKKEKAGALDELEKLKKKITAWNKAQHVRLSQQILYIVSFILSMLVFCPKVPKRSLNALVNFSMAGANAIPLYMDVFWPFKRNTTLVVPKVEMDVDLDVT